MTQLEKGSSEYAQCLGDAIVALSYYFCGVPLNAQPPVGSTIEGRSKDDAIYREVTENRDGPTPEQRRRYSSCADQLHCILERLGVRESWINRGTNHIYGTPQMSRLEPFDARTNPGGSKAASWVSEGFGWRPVPGTLGLLWATGNDAHACVLLGPGSNPGHWLTGNYGAGGMSPSARPGADVADSPIVDTGGRLLVGTSHRMLHVIIPPAAIVPFISAQIDLTGAEVSGELVDALGAKFG